METPGTSRAAVNLSGNPTPGTSQAAANSSGNPTPGTSRAAANSSGNPTPGTSQSAVFYLSGNPTPGTSRAAANSSGNPTPGTSRAAFNLSGISQNTFKTPVISGTAGGSGRSESSPSLPPFARGTTLVQLALKNNSTSNDYSSGSSDLEESGVLTMEDGQQVPLGDVFFADIDEVFLTYLIHSKLSSLQFSNVFPVAKIFTLG